MYNEGMENLTIFIDTNLKYDDPTHYAYRENLFRLINNKIQSQLTSSEYKLLMFIITRTLGCNKLSEKIKIDHFRYGIFDKKSGHTVCDGLKMSKQTIIKYTASLEEKHLIKRIKTFNNDYNLARSYEYSVNFDYVNAIFDECKMFNKRRHEMAGKFPKKQIKKTYDEPENLDLPKGQPGDTVIGQPGDTGIKINNNKKINNLDGAKLNFGTNENLKGKFKNKNLKAYFEVLLKEKYPNSFQTLSGRDKGSLNNLAARLAENDSIDTFDFIDYVFDNWNAIRASRFNWATDFPKAPVAGHIVRWLVEFIEEYNTRTIDYKFGTTNDKANKVLKLTRQGVKEDMAIKIITEEEIQTKKEILGQSSELDRKKEEFARQAKMKADELRSKEIEMEAKVKQLERENRKLQEELELSKRPAKKLDILKGSRFDPNNVELDYEN